MTSKEPIHGVGDIPPVEYYENDGTRHGAQKLKSAFRTIKEEYDQINHDEEREKIEDALEIIDGCINHNLQQVMDEVYPNSRVMHALEEGDLIEVSVSEEPCFRDARKVNVELEVMLPLE